MSSGRPPLALPIRILVKGASTVSSVGRMGGPRSDLAYPRAVEAGLLAAGRPARVRTISLASERAKSTLLHWEREVLGWSPDVIVLNYGYYESMHLFLPWWFERHANSTRSRPRRGAELYRRWLLRKVWMASARLQARLDAAIDPTLRRGRPRRVAADLSKLIDRVQEVGSPLVFVVELLPPGSRYRSWFPGMTARVEVMNAAMQAVVVAKARDNVRFFDVRPIAERIAGGDTDVALPDGFHFSPEMHRAIGEELACLIADWADTQPHLVLPGAGRDSAGAVEEGQ